MQVVNDIFFLFFLSDQSLDVQYFVLTETESKTVFYLVRLQF